MEGENRGRQLVISHPGYCSCFLASCPDQTPSRRQQNTCGVEEEDALEVKTTQRRTEAMYSKLPIARESAPSLAIWQRVKASREWESTTSKKKKKKKV